MGIENIIGNIMDNYMPVRNINEASKYIFNNLIKKDLVNEILELTESYKLEIKGHTRVSRWADIPWIGIGDTRIDCKAMTGIYIAILFRADGKEVFLSIQQGTDKLSIEEIKSRVSVLRKNKYLTSKKFMNSDLKINQEKSELGFKLSQRARKYEIANILGKSYSRENIKDIPNDLLALIKVYIRWIENELKLYNEENINYIKEDEENYNMTIDMEQDTIDKINEAYENKIEKAEDLSNNKKKKEELNNRIPELAQSQKGRKYKTDDRIIKTALSECDYKCFYDENHQLFKKKNGQNYVEGHHIIPMSAQDDFKFNLDRTENVVALCPYCHKAIHNGDENTVTDILIKIFKDREEELKKAGIMINIYDLYNGYYK